MAPIQYYMQHPKQIRRPLNAPFCWVFRIPLSAEREKPFKVSHKDSVTTVAHLTKIEEDEQNLAPYSAAT